MLNNEAWSGRKLLVSITGRRVRDFLRLFQSTRDLGSDRYRLNSPWKNFCRSASPCRCLESPSSAAPCHSSHHRHRQSAKNRFDQPKLRNFRWSFFSRGGWSGWVTFNRLSYAVTTIWRRLRKTIEDANDRKVDQSTILQFLTEDFHFTILNYALRVIIRLEIDERRKGSSEKRKFSRWCEKC